MKRKKVTDLEKELELLGVRLDVYSSLRKAIFEEGLINNNPNDIEELTDRMEMAKLSCQRICRDLREQFPHIESNITFMTLLKKYEFYYYSCHFKGGF